jgi:hypothetical protein
MANIDTSTWNLLPVCTSLNGRNKSAPICSKNQAVKVKLEETYAPFGASNFNPEEKVRLNLDVSCTESHLAFCKKVDEWALKQLAKDTKQYFKKHLTEAELKQAYRPLATPHEKNGIQYPPTIRLKIMTEGPNKLRVWSKDKELREMPEDFRTCKILAVQVAVKSIWLMNSQAGVLLEASDIIVQEDDVSCPFD